jgi:hypothetical protein
MGWRKWLAVALLAVAAAAVAVAAQDAPGAAKVARHRSRWKYPLEVSPGQGQSLHIVEKGDTLWDLGRKYLGNPYVWPQIWEMNRWVEDPHWIYPGDPLLVPTGSQALGASDGPDPAVADLVPDRPAAAHHGRTGYAYAFRDFLQLPYLASRGAGPHFRKLGALRITGCQKEDRQCLSRGDIVYLDGGRKKGLRVGDRMVVLKVAKRGLTHPDAGPGGRSMGDVVQHAAILRVLAVHAKNAEAAIEDTLDGVDVGDQAVRYEPPALIQAKDAPLRQDTRGSTDSGARAKIIYGRNGATLLGHGDLVLIDGGGRKGIVVGDVLLVLRDRQMVQDGGGAAASIYLGQLLAVRVDDASSTCLVLSCKLEMEPGDTAAK